MNYVFHHRLATTDGEGSAAALGAMLPDLFRMIARSARATKATLEGASIEPQLLRGMQHHLAVDAWFHDTPSFHRGEDGTRELLRETGIARASLFAHVVIEMALDGALIRRHGDALRDAVAASIDGREAAALDAFHVVSRGRTTSVEDAMLVRLLAGVRSFALPEGYADARGLADRLQGIRKRFGFPALTHEEREGLERALEGVLAIAEPLALELERAWSRRDAGLHLAPGAPQR